MKRKPEECVRLYATSNLIRTLMRLSGVTITELAARSGVAASTAHGFVSGKLVDFSPGQAEKYAEALQVRADLLFIKMRNTVAMEELAMPAGKSAA